MKKIYITIGIAGCGKSTWSKNKNLKIFSSDEYREKFNYKEGTDNKILFEHLHKDILAYDSDCIYDATNISRKIRIPFYKEAKKAGFEVISILFVCPLKTALKQNQIRTRHVPENVIRRMFENLEIPKIGLDSDKIEVVIHKDIKEELNNMFDLMNIAHNSPWHKETILEHVKTTIQLANTPELKLIAQYHDIGKIFVKVPNKYIPTISHFYNHEKVSAIYFMAYLSLTNQINIKMLNLAETIFLHNYNELTNEMIVKHKINSEVIKLFNEFKIIDKNSQIIDETRMKQFLELKERLAKN